MRGRSAEAHNAGAVRSNFRRVQREVGNELFMLRLLHSATASARGAILPENKAGSIAIKGEFVERPGRAKDDRSVFEQPHCLDPDEEPLPPLRAPQ